MHVPPIDAMNNGRIAYGDNGSLTQFLKRRVIRFTPSRLNATWDEKKFQWNLGASIAPVVRQHKGRNGEKRANKRTKWQRREDAIIGRMLAEVKQDGKL